MVRSLPWKDDFFFLAVRKGALMYPRAQANSFVLPPADESLLPAMAKRTASQMSEEVVKETPITVVDEFDHGLLKIKQTGLNEEEMPILKVFYDSHRLTLNLTPGKKWVQVKWKVEASPFETKDP